VSTKKILLFIAALLALLIAMVMWAFGSTPVPDTSQYTLPLDDVKQLAKKEGQPLPVAIQAEPFATTSMFHAMVYEGASFETASIEHTVFRVVYDDGRSVIIDAGFTEDQLNGINMGGHDPTYDSASWARIEAAMASADWIVLTHEHLDHMQGILRQPTKDVLDALHITPEQLANDAWFDPSDYPEGFAQNARQLPYDRFHPLAPGVVLIKAAGHTPGSQMIFVELADGQAFLFVGDVAWQEHALNELSYRPRWITQILGEDRDAVLHQFRTLHQLNRRDDVHVVVSHDAQTRKAAGLTAPFSGSF